MVEQGAVLVDTVAQGVVLVEMTAPLVVFAVAADDQIVEFVVALFVAAGENLCRLSKERCLKAVVGSGSH